MSEKEKKLETGKNSDVNEQVAPHAIKDLVYDWLESTEEQDFEAILYKKEGRHKKQFVICRKYENFIPEPEEVGNSFGGGNYKVWVKIYGESRKEDRVKVFHFALHSSYNNRIGGGVGPVNVPMVQNNQLQQEQQNNNSLEIMREMMMFQSKMTQSLMTALMASKENNSPFDMSEIMGRMYESMNGILMKGMEDQHKAMKKMYGNNPYEPKEEEQVEGTGNKLIDGVLPLISQFLPSILQSSPIQQKATATMMKNTPQYKQIVSDNRSLGLLINYLEKSQGKDTVDKLLNVLKIRRPIQGQRRRRNNVKVQ